MKALGAKSGIDAATLEHLTSRIEHGCNHGMFWFHSGFIFVSCFVNLGSIQFSSWFRCCFILVSFGFNSGVVLVSFWFHSGSGLVLAWLRSGFIFGPLWFPSGWS